MEESGGPAGSQASLREVNTARVVDTVKKYGHITQVELVAATGLSPATISNIVKQLHAQGVVETRNTVRTGRRAQMVTLARTTALAVGVSIGSRDLRVEVSDATREVRAGEVLPLPVDHRADTTLDRTALLIMELIEGLGADLGEVAGIGVALPAPVDPVTHKITVPGIMRGWEGLDVVDVLSSRLNRPVLVENDANAGAIAEARYGALRGVADAIYVRASHQTGAGILIGGRLHRGPGGTAGEIGHVQVDPQGSICRCGGRGCLNTVIGADALTDLLRISRGSLALHDIISLADEGDPGCRQVITDAGRALGSALADLAVLVNPRAVVVGGELAQAGELLLEPIRSLITSRPLLASAEVSVTASLLGANAAPLGVFALALEAFDPNSTTRALPVPPVATGESGPTDTAATPTVAVSAPRRRR